MEDKKTTKDEVLLKHLLRQQQTHLRQLTALLERVGIHPRPDVAPGWVEGTYVMEALNISRRTLQTLRDNHTLGYSRLGGKYYYLISEIEELLRNNYVMYNLARRGKEEPDPSDEEGGRP